MKWEQVSASWKAGKEIKMNDFIKEAYDMGVQAALEELGLMEKNANRRLWRDTLLRAAERPSNDRYFFDLLPERLPRVNPEGLGMDRDLLHNRLRKTLSLTQEDPRNLDTVRSTFKKMYGAKDSATVGPRMDLNRLSPAAEEQRIQRAIDNYRFDVA